jgi:hypothetical protein
MLYYNNINNDYIELELIGRGSYIPFFPSKIKKNAIIAKKIEFSPFRVIVINEFNDINKINTNNLLEINNINNKEKINNLKEKINNKIN